MRSASIVLINVWELGSATPRASHDAPTPHGRTLEDVGDAMTIEQEGAVGVHALSERIAALAVELGDNRAEVISQFLSQLGSAIEEECQNPTSGWPATSNCGTNATKVWVRVRRGKPRHASASFHWA
jgi:hypothetical protein